MLVPHLLHLNDFLALSICSPTLFPIVPPAAAPVNNPNKPPATAPTSVPTPGTTEPSAAPAAAPLAAPPYPAAAPTPAPATVPRVSPVLSRFTYSFVSHFGHFGGVIALIISLSRLVEYFELDYFGATAKMPLISLRITKYRPAPRLRFFSVCHGSSPVKQAQSQHCLHNL